MGERPLSTPGRPLFDLRLKSLPPTTTEQVEDESWKTNINSWAPTLAGATASAAVGALVAPTLISGAAGLAGFGAGGVAAGSLAASWMSSIGTLVFYRNLV